MQHIKSTLLLQIITTTKYSDNVNLKSLSTSMGLFTSLPSDALNLLSLHIVTSRKQIRGFPRQLLSFKKADVQ